MLVRDDLGVKANLKARFLHSVVDFVILGSREPFVKKPDFIENIAFIRAVEKRVNVGLSLLTAVGSDRASEHRGFNKKQSFFPWGRLVYYIRSESSADIFSAVKSFDILLDKVAGD